MRLEDVRKVYTMSKTELHTGILRKVDTKGLSPEDWCREQVLLIDPRREKHDFEKWSWILEEYNNTEKYLITNTDVYELYDTEHDYEDYCDIHKNPNGTYSYRTQFYNGGACLQDVLIDGLNELNE